jgi:WD40 repeat protein
LAQVWDATNGSTIFTYRGHVSQNKIKGQPGGLLHAVAWSPDGGKIASASLDGVVHVWKAPA